MKPKILVVEDEALIAMHIKAILEEVNYEVCIDTNSVEAAITHIEADSPNIVLIDINLNKSKDGIALGHYLLEKKHIPYLYITSYVDNLTLDRVKETRPNGYIVKPFKASDLITNVSIILNNCSYKRIDLPKEPDTPIETTPYYLKQVVRYINDNIDKKLEIDELVELTEWQRHHFIKLFIKYLAVSPYQYILSRKIEKSKSLLIDTNIPISQIAFDLGFSSYSNFCNAFKKNNQVVPFDYRRKYGRLNSN
ncbi:MAG: response regulator transcription factor [Arcicella sp.]|jgi:AraC-like DNA-binding protein|nr:response regulator transcription factor [Arcicella sp.]